MWWRSVVLLAAIVCLSGCRQDMHNQPAYRPYAQAAFFPNNSSARPRVDGTIARGALHDRTLSTGFEANEPAAAFPFAITAADLQRGRERFNIFCSPCHGELGNGAGMIVRRGFRPARNFHTEQMRAAPPGHFVDVINRGFGAMPPYGSRVPMEDRWRIAAYIRALQLSQSASLNDVPPEARSQLQQGGDQP